MNVRRFRSAVTLLSLVALPALAGCSCGTPTVTPTRCTSQADCSGGLVCIDNKCIPRVDSGAPLRPDANVPGRDLGPSSSCVDTDGDGFGEGCTNGADCNDTDANQGGSPNEICNGRDDNCNGTVDERVREACGANCSPTCQVLLTPPGGTWMPNAMNSDGVVVDMTSTRPAITLGRTEARSFAVWVANMDDGTVSKMDSRTNTEIARYPSVGQGAPAGARPFGERCGWCDPMQGGAIGNCPSRTAVDQNFDAYVANRAFCNQGTVTKYANREQDCIDRNANGVIDTSRDLNGDGTIDQAGAEFVGLADECILWTVPVGRNGNGTAAGGTPRALSVGLANLDAVVGDVWVGLFDERSACRLDAATGRSIACMPIGNFMPYGFTSDASDRIWMVDRSGARRDILGYIDANTMMFRAVSPMPGTQCAIPYGVTVDGENHVYLANQCQPALWRYDIATDTWQMMNFPAPGTPRGVAADETSLWVGVSHSGNEFQVGLDNRVIQYRLSDLSLVAQHRIPTGTGPVGVGVSFDGSVWAICQGTNSAARLDPLMGTWVEHAVGRAPYTYSDFIGFGLNTFAQPRGSYRVELDGCASGTTTWEGVNFDAEIPARTGVEVFARTADTRMALPMEPWVGPFPNPARFSMPPGPLPRRNVLQVELRMRTDDRRTAPRVFTMDVAYTCERDVQ